MTIELAKQQAEKASGFMVNAERVEHRTYTHTILVENNNQPQTKNQLKMAGQAAMKLPSTRKQALYQHNHLAPFKQPCGCKTRGADVGGMYYHITFFGALEPGAMFCNSHLNGQSPTWRDPNQENGKYCLQAMHLTFIARRRYSSSVQCL
jgi:hypothetical protein